MAKTVVFLGAGATGACLGPMTDDILPLIYKRAVDPTSGWSINLLKNFLEQEFHVNAASPKVEYPALPLVMSLIDTAIDRRQSLNANWDVAMLTQLREQVEFALFDLLEVELNRVLTTNHYALLNKLCAETGEVPCVISTNYDLIIDTALMFRSYSQRSDEGPHTGRLPDYRCRISTSYYQADGERCGTLLKLHGSLNWLYCKTCQRLEMGAVKSQRYGNVLEKLLGPDVAAAVTPDGAPCSTCGTKVRPLLIAPSHLKDYRNPHLTQVWYEAERVLREATRVIFIGYSLPDDDLEVVYLLKRCLTRPVPPAITVVEYSAANVEVAAKDHVVGRRYRTLFGDGIDWHACGMDAWIAKQVGSRTTN